MSRAFTHKIVIVCTFMLKNVASLLKRRLKVKYYVLGLKPREGFTANLGIMYT